MEGKQVNTGLRAITKQVEIGSNEKGTRANSQTRLQLFFHKNEDQFSSISEQRDFHKSLFSSTDLNSNALAALKYASRYCALDIDDSRDCSIFSSNESGASEPLNILCLVLGEGSFPRTAILAAICQGWVAVAIDENLHPEWRGIRDEITNSSATAGKYFGFKGSMKDFLVNGQRIIKANMSDSHYFHHIIMIGIESQNNLRPLHGVGGLFGVADLRELYDKAPVTVVSLSSEDSTFSDGSSGCQNMSRPFSSEPKFSFVDTNTSSSFRQFDVWRFPSSGAYSTSSSNQSSCKSTLSSGVKSSASMERNLPKKHLGIEGSSIEGSISESIMYGRNTKKFSRAAQLQLQQTLAAENRYMSRVSVKKIIPISAPGKNKADDRKSSFLSFLQPRSQLAPPQSEPPCSSVSKFHEVVNMTTPIITNIKKSPSIPKNAGNPNRCAPKTEHSTIRRENEQDSSHKSTPLSSSLPPRRDTCDKSISSLDVTYASTIDSDETHSSSGDSLSTHTRSRASSLTQEFHEGDIVEVRIDNISQMGVIEMETFKGFYNVKLLSDTPAWNNLRSNVDLYTKYYASGVLPEVPARHLRPFHCAKPGEVLNVWVKGKEYSFQVQGLEDGGTKNPKFDDMKYIVRFSDKNSSGWRQIKHRVAVQKAYQRHVVFSV